jgi:hypothetical protein
MVEFGLFKPMKPPQNRLGTFCVLSILFATMAVGLGHAASVTTITDAGEGKYKVSMADKHFTTLHTKGQAKPMHDP